MDFYRPPTTQGTLDALSALYRAVRAQGFYPKGHPTRRSSLTLAHGAMVQLLNNNTLSLACGRTAFSFPDGEVLKDTRGMSAALAYELFIRRVQKITFSHDLFQEDLLEFLKLLCLSPEMIQNSGGIDTLMAEHGIRSIWVNEFDLSVIRSKRRKVEMSGIIPPGIDETESESETIPAVELLPQQQNAPPPEQQLQTLLAKLATCDDDDIYLILIRQTVALVDDLPLQRDPFLLFPLVELLAGHGDDALRTGRMQEYAQFALEQIFSRGELLSLVLEQAGQDNGVSPKALSAMARAAGAPAVTLAIDLMGHTGSLKARKALSTLLGSLGEDAVPPLLNLMQDQRWFIIRNICAILGAIASHEALPALVKCLRHPDLRVRKEAIRSLARLGGNEAEAAVIGVLRDTDAALYPQAIASLGGMKSRRALPELMKIAFSKDIFLKSLSIKLDALTAIALIADRQATPYLCDLLEERHLLAATRARHLKVAVAVCLGKIGDSRAVPVLEKLAARDDELGAACSEALTMIERTEGKADGIS